MRLTRPNSSPFPRRRDPFDREIPGDPASALRGTKSHAPTDIKPTFADLYDLICGHEVSVLDPTERRDYEAKLNAFQSLQRIVDATTEVFGDEVRVKSDCDPEFPDDRYTVFVVRVKAPPKEIVAMEEQWVKRVNAIAPGVALFRLSLTAVP